jgi:hypothetical protein
VLGDVGQPQPVRGIGGEVVFDQVVVDRRPGQFAFPAAPLPERRPAQLRAELPGGPLGHRLTRDPGLVDQEPVAELGVVAVGDEQRVGAVGRGQLGVGDGFREPAVVGLAGDLSAPDTSP